MCIVCGVNIIDICIFIHRKLFCLLSRYFRTCSRMLGVYVCLRVILLDCIETLTPLPEL